MTDDLSNTHQIMNKIDDIKDKLSNQEYIELCNLLMKKASENDWHNQLYRVRYFKQEMKLIIDDDDDDDISTINYIKCEHKIVICKFHKDVHIDDIINFVNSVNRRYKGERNGCNSGYDFTENIEDGVTRIKLYRNHHENVEYATPTSIINNQLEDRENIYCKLNYQKDIIYSIEKVE